MNRCLLLILLLLSVVQDPAQAQASYISELVDRLRSSDLSTREQAARDLGRQSRPAIPALRGALQDPNPQVRALAARALAWLKPSSAAEGKLLAQSLEDANAEVRREAAWAIGRVEPVAAKAATSALVKALSDPDHVVRGHALSGVARIGPPAKEAVTRLIEFLDAPQPHMRRGAVYALGRIGPEAAAALPALTSGFTDERSQPELAQAIRQIDPSALPSTPSQNTGNRSALTVAGVAMAFVLLTLVLWLLRGKVHPHSSALPPLDPSPR